MPSVAGGMCRRVWYSYQGQMKKNVISCVLPALLVVVGSAFLYVWLTTEAAWDIVERLPGGDGRVVSSGGAVGAIKIAGGLETFSGKPSQLTGAWPAFRGAGVDGISTEEVELSRKWSPDGPVRLWSVEMGEGFAGAAVLGGRVYVLDYDRPGKSDAVRCLSLDDGAEIWRYSYPVKIKRNHGMSRTVPAVTDKYVVTLGPLCHVTCLDSTTGAFGWMLNLQREYGTKVPLWYTAQCPLIDDGKAIIAPAGPEVLMMAVDCQSGQVVWKCPNPDGWVMTHSSVVPMEFGGRRFYVYCGGDDANGGIVGVSAEDGRVLWKYDGWKMRINVPVPVVVGGDRIFVCAGYGQYEKGCAMLRLVDNGGAITVELVFEFDTQRFGSMQQSPVYYRGYLYGVRMADKQMVCLDTEGNVVWASSSAKKFGHGPYMIANGVGGGGGGVIYAMDDDGLLRMVKAEPSGYIQLGEAKVLDGHESWGPMALVSGRLIVRDVTRMVCLDVSSKIRGATNEQ